MSSHKPFSYFVIAAALFAASCVTVVASPGRAAGPGAQIAGSMEVAQAADGTTVVVPAENVPAAGTEAPVAAAVGSSEQSHEPVQAQAGQSCPHGGGCAKCAAGGCDHGAGCAKCAGHGGMTGMGMPASPGDPERLGPTDHQRVVGRWGIEARSLGTLQSSGANPDPRCTGPTGSPIDGCRNVNMIAIGIRRWHTEKYAYSAGLTLGAGGGSTAGLGSWDTYVGVGPNFGAYFLLGQWKHLALSASPQLGLLYFAPSGSGNKTFSANLAGKLEAELQLGFIGLPGLSVGTDVGLGFNYTNVSENDAKAGGFSHWSLGTTGPSSLWGLVTGSFVRFYL